MLQVLLWAVVIAVNQVFLNDDGNIPLEWYLPTSIRILGGLVGMIGVGLTAGSIYAFVRIDQVPNVFPLPAPGCPLITTGVYSFMRHPGYVGNVSLFIAGSLSLWGVDTASSRRCCSFSPSITSKQHERRATSQKNLAKSGTRTSVVCPNILAIHPSSVLAGGGRRRAWMQRSLLMMTKTKMMTMTMTRKTRRAKQVSGRTRSRCCW